ncbi:MAG: methionyl-tRNA formyltransferase [Gammaproteobacteria bacterium]
MSAARIVFAGTPPFAATILQALLDHALHPIVAVYSQPDRPAGRGLKLTSSPVKSLAAARGIEVRTPGQLRGPEEEAQFAALGPDLMVVVGYGQILRPAVLAIPRLGAINVHASLLPRWRGAAPIERAILAGDAATGVSIMQVSERLDAGPVWAEVRCPITAQDTAGALAQRLAALGAACLLEQLDAILERRIEPRPQDERGVTYAAKIERAEARLDWQEPAQVLARKVRAFHPRPMAWASVKGLELRVWEAEAAGLGTRLAPGTVAGGNRRRLEVATGQGTLRLLRVQLPGRRPVTADALLNARPDLLAPA